MKPNRTRYVESLGQELHSQSNRVRDLIGDRHWPSDGFHKEFVFKSVLERHVPDGYLVSRGFLIDPLDDLVSTEQDLLVLDMASDSLPFNQGGLAISFPSSAAASLSIKTGFTAATVKDSFVGLMSMASVWKRVASPLAPWMGAFFFDTDTSKLELGIDWIQQQAEQTAPVRVPLTSPSDFCFPACFATMGGLLYQLSLEPKGENQCLSIRGLRLRSGAAAVFLGLVIGALCNRRGNNTFLGDLIENESVIEEQLPPRTVDLSST
jgi:hypothetical protein